MCEWHQFQGLNIVINLQFITQSRQYFRVTAKNPRATRGRGNLITPPFYSNALHVYKGLYRVPPVNCAPLLLWLPNITMFLCLLLLVSSPSYHQVFARGVGAARRASEGRRNKYKLVGSA